jgi:hypothetical protein
MSPDNHVFGSVGQRFWARILLFLPDSKSRADSGLRAMSGGTASIIFYVPSEQRLTRHLVGFSATDFARLQP